MHLRTGGQAGSRIGLGSIPAAGFKLAFGADSVHHEPIAEHDAANIRAAWLADGAQPWVGSFSDLAQALAVGAAADESPTAVGPATFLVTPGASDATGSHWWSVAVNFVMDGISWLADLVIECLADALDAVMSFFAAVGAFFKDLFAFLGYLFDWPDILRTADAVSYGITQVLELVSSAVAGLQGQVAGGIASAKTNVAEWFAGLQAKAQSMGSIAAVGNQGERADAASTSPVLSGVSNNVLMNALMDHGAAAQPVSISSFSLDDDDPSAMFVALSTAEGQDPNALVSLTAGLQGHMAGPAGLDKFVQTSVSTILQLIEQAVQAILDGAQAVADALFNIIQWAVKQTNDFLTAPLEIPLLTNLYTTVVNPGQPLTIAGLSSIIVAVPATVIYKLVAGSAPFPTDGDVNSFKTNYTVSAMQKSSGLTPSGAPTLGRLGARPGLVESDAPPVPTQTYVPVRSEAQLLAGIISGVSSLVGGVLAAISDTELPLVASSPPADAPSSPLASFYKVVGTIAVACDVSAAAFSLPGVWDADGGSPEPAEVILWTYSAVGTVVDLGMLVASGSRRARGNAFRDGVAVAWTMYGGIHCLLVGIVALTADDLGWTWLPDMLAGVAEVTQVGLTSTFMGETGDLSAVVTVAAQVFASVGGGIITIGDAVASYKK